MTGKIRNNKLKPHTDLNNIFHNLFKFLNYFEIILLIVFLDYDKLFNLENQFYIYTILHFVAIVIN